MMKYNSLAIVGQDLHCLEYLRKQERKMENAQQTLKAKTGTRIFSQKSQEKEQEDMEN